MTRVALLTIPLALVALLSLSPLSPFVGVVVSAIGAQGPTGTTADTRVITPPGVTVIGPYSPGIMAGDFLYVSGQGGRDAEGRLPGTIEGQVRQTLQNVKAVVEAAGLTLEHVVYSQVYLTDMAHHDTMDRVWREFFPTAPPARAVLGVYRLPTDIAGRDQRRRLPRPRAEEGHRPAGHRPDAASAAAVMAGNRLFLSGALGADEATGTIPLDPDAQVQLALDNMRRTLTAAGMDFRHVVFVNPYLTGTASRQMNDIYAKHFEFGNTPARATISVTSLPGGNTIEFTGVAIADLSMRRAVRPKNMKPSATASPCVMADDTYYCSAKGPFTPGPPSGQVAFRASGSAPSRRRSGRRCGTCSTGWRRPGWPCRTWWPPTCIWTT